MRNGEFHSSIPETFGTTGVGTWDYDVSAGLFFLDLVASKLMGLDPEDGLRGLPEVLFLAAINPVDRAKGLDTMKLLLREGGVFVFEHRVNPRPDVERWLLARGRYVKNGEGVVARGRGIVIDISHQKAGGFVGGTAAFADPVPSAEVAPRRRHVGPSDAATPKAGALDDRIGDGSALLEIAEYLIAAHRLARSEYDDEATMALVTAALFHVGERLKAEVPPDDATAR